MAESSKKLRVNWKASISPETLINPESLSGTVSDLANYPRPAQLAQAEEKRQTAYKLYLRGQLEREIAEYLHVSQGRVSQYLGQMKDRNVKWYEEHSDPRQRRKSLTKEVADQYRDVLREQWMIYAKQEKDGMKAKLLGDITRTLDSYAAKLGLVVPSMDQAWLEDQVRELNAAKEELRQKAKIIPLI